MSLNRVLAVGLLAASFSQPAAAADYLRGAYGGHQQQSSPIDWAGFYAGAHVGYTSSSFDYPGLPTRLATSAWPTTEVLPLVADTIILSKTNKRMTTLGGFAGINYLWDDVVLGIEADYTHGSATTNSNFGPYGLARTINGTNYVAQTTTSSNGSIKDWGTIRGRIGYASGYFMPYVTVGLAMGMMGGRTTTVADVCNATLNPGCPAGSVLTRNGTVSHAGVSYGTVLGAGVDMQFFPNTFLRAEYQYVNFVSSRSRPEVVINTARVGGGVKF